MTISHLFRHPRRRQRGNTAELAAQLAPLEEQHVGATQEAGAIVIDADSHRLSNDIIEGQYGKSFLGMEPVVIVILVVMLTFIAFIAWQISMME